MVGVSARSYEKTVLHSHTRSCTDHHRRFKDPKSYDLVSGSDKLTIHDLANLAPGKDVKITGKRADGSEYEFLVTHTVSIILLWSQSASTDSYSSMKASWIGSERARL